MSLDKYSVLKQYFGYASFREGQEELIDCILSGRDVLGIMPTGAGKSLCFQIPALLFPGMTLVVSPLISLMKDQVGALVQAGVPAAYLNSSLTPAQHAKALDNARAGRYKILYVAPERLETEAFLRFARGADISMVCVDEAHCVSQWGQDFRASYLSIAEFVRALEKRPVVAAFTATATREVREDILRLLELREAHVAVTGFDRPNLSFEVLRPDDKQRELTYLLSRFDGKSGIIYCATRKAVEDIESLLSTRKIPATRYHAGLTDEERRRNQDDFLFDRKRIMVATNAFGMGIDKSNVAFVIHYNMPKNLESYYQEAGRAGRDGEHADCILLYSPQDVRTNRFLIEHSDGNMNLTEEEQKRVRERDLERLKEMTYYCTIRTCLREYMLRYFGETAPNFCGNCSNCRANFETVDVTLEAQKILSCVRRAGERYGAQMIVNILRGSKNERVLAAGLDTLSTYGIMAEESERRVRDILAFLQTAGFLIQTDGEYPVLKLAPGAAGVLFHGERVEMFLAREEERPRAEKADGPENHILYEALRRLRARLAREQHIPAYHVFTDATLHDMCRREPRSEAEFLQVSGVGEAKLARYGEDFIELIRSMG